MFKELRLLLTGKVLKINSESENGLLYLPLQESIPQAPVVQELSLGGGSSKVVSSSFKEESVTNITEIDIDTIVTNPNQPRKIFDQTALQDLAESIKIHGIIQPIVVTRVSNGYEIIVGERRYRACLLAGMKRVPVIVKGKIEDQTKLEVALIENIQRQDLNPIEEAQAYQQLMLKYNLTQNQVAKKVGKSRPSISNTLRLLQLPEIVQQAVIDGKISEGHARSLLPLQDKNKIEQLYHAIVEQGLNVRQVETKVKDMTVVRKVDGISMPDVRVKSIETSLRGKLGAPVKIMKVGKGGRITIDFYSEEELQVIVDHMLEKKLSEEALVSVNTFDNQGYFNV